MAEIERTVGCPLPGLEAVKITYNLMASAKEIDAWTQSVGERFAAKVVTKVEGWPGGEFGQEPFGADSPLAFRVWACQKGIHQAIREFVSDPN